MERGRDSRWLLNKFRASSPFISEIVVGRFVSLLWDNVSRVRWETRDKGEMYSVMSEILRRGDVRCDVKAVGKMGVKFLNQ